MLKNLLSNAFKFTERGGVKLKISRTPLGLELATTRSSSRRRTVIAFEVADTGIGIPPEKQKIIFEAFQQADASTSRRYGGTGLGLAISRELSNLLGGEIQLRSTPGVGSAFTLYLPLRYLGPLALPRPEHDAAGAGVRSCRITLAGGPRRPSRSATTGSTIEPGDLTLLIVEDDPHYARIIADLARDRGLQGPGRRRAAPRRSTSPAQYRPTAISLDVFLPDMLGWTVLSQLKQNPATRHIPVQIITLDEDRQHGLARGAFAFTTQADDDRGRRDGARRASRITRGRAASACWSSRTIRPSSSASASCSAMTTSRSTTVDTGDEALAAPRRNPPSTASCSTCACPT